MGSWARCARAKKVSKLKPFWRARAARPGPLSPQGPLSKESVLEAFSVGGGGIKWPVQRRFCFFRGFTWAGHFIETFSVGGGGIKWPFQHRFCVDQPLDTMRVLDQRTKHL